MKGSRVCVAGLTKDGRHIRPITKSGFHRSDLQEEGGKLALGAFVDLGDVRANPTPPETEDHWCWHDQVKLKKMVRAPRYWVRLAGASHRDVSDAFGSALVRRRNWKATVSEHTGSRSLAIVPAAQGSSVKVDRRPEGDRVTFKLPAKDKPYYVPVTDTRFFGTDQVSINEDLVGEVDAMLRAGREAFLMVGLSRPFMSHGDTVKRHWLQVNGISFRDSPLQLP